MAIIKKFTFFQKSKIKNLTYFVGQNSFGGNLIHTGIYFLNFLLPLKFKFTKEAFVALDDKEIKGLIELQKEMGNPLKLRITKLFLEKNSYDIGEQLINYVISRYCAYGANSFYIVFDENFNEMANLFIEGSKFRVGSYETIYKIDREKINNLDKRGLNFCDFKLYGKSRAQQVSQAYNDMILPHLRPVFEKNKKYFSESSTSSYFKETSFKYIFESTNGDIYGYFSITSIDDKDYILDVSLSSSFENYFMDIICFAIEQIEKRSKNWDLYIKIKHYFSSSSSMLSQAEEYQFEFFAKNMILVRDFFKPVKQDILQNAKILFNDVNPIFRQKTQN